MTKRRARSEPRPFWSTEEDALLRRAYPDATAPAIAALLPWRTVSAIYARAKALGLTKSAAFLASPASGRTRGDRGQATRFCRGQPSWNKGRSYQPGGDAARHQFRPGTRPHNWTPVGTKRLTTTDRYWKVKVAEPSVWRFVHVVLWEAAHGPAPKGTAIAFKDGDRNNCTLDNLELVDRRALMQRNSVHNLPAPLPQLVQLRGALVRQINRRVRQKAAHEE